MSFKSDIEIAQSTSMQNIIEVSVLRESLSQVLNYTETTRQRSI